MLDFSSFLKSLGDSKNIAITAPAGADGDSVGTQCSLKELLEAHLPKSIKIRIVNEEPCPRRYQFLKGASSFEVSSQILKSGPQDFPDTFICVDGGVSRIGADTTQLWNQAKKHGQVDHHALGGDGKAYQFRLYDPEAASTTEIVFKFAKSLGFNLTQSFAEAIYVGLIFDTGLFKHSNTRPETLRIAAELLETRFNHTDVAEKAMMLRSPGAFSMLQTVLAGSKKDFSGKFVYGVLDYTSFQKAGGDADDREGLIDNLFLIQGCEISALYFEKSPGDWKLSFRSRGWNVAELARSLNPEGGGHKLAAGCSVKGNLESVHKSVTESVRKLLAP